MHSQKHFISVLISGVSSTTKDLNLIELDKINKNSSRILHCREFLSNKVSGNIKCLCGSYFLEEICDSFITSIDEKRAIYRSWK